MSFQVQDHYFQRAKKERYLARAVYKLQEIQKKHRILHKGSRVLDLGAAPGSWMQFTEPIIGSRGLLVGVDLQPISYRPGRHVVTLRQDIFDESFPDKLKELYGPFDAVLSDMAPKTSGIKVADAARSALLVERALEIAEAVLKPRGHFLAKIFQGSDFHQILSDVKKRFKRVKVIKPDATRKGSKEVYILALDFKANRSRVEDR